MKWLCPKMILPFPGFVMPASFINPNHVLEHIVKLPHSRATYKQLVKELRLQGDSREELDAALDRLVSRG